MNDNKIILALDGFKTPGRAIEFLDSIEAAKERLWGIKTNDMLDAVGARTCSRMADPHMKFMADPKLYDIPNTVENRMRQYVGAEADFVTVHASGGPEMMEAAVKVCEGTNTEVLAVTVLTSFDKETLRKVYQTDALEWLVHDFAVMALNAGAAGIVCSLADLHCVKGLAGHKVVPGIRPDWYHKRDDQRRTATPRDAIENGATHIVIGRPIVQSSDPVAAINKTLSELPGRAAIKS
jgi:orotidine-5'-phosphate decarboxylase